MPGLVPGLFSAIGRSTEQEVSKLRDLCGVHLEDEDEGSGDEGDFRPVSTAAGKASAASRPALKTPASVGTGGRRREEQQGPPQRGDLARAIQERVRQNLAAAAAARENENDDAAAAAAAATTAGVAFAVAPHKRGMGGAVVSTDARDDLPTTAFSAQGMDSWWTDRFTANHDVGHLNRRGEHKPDPGWYRPHYETVNKRYPSWDIGARPSSSSRSRIPQAQQEVTMLNVAEGEDIGGTMRVSFDATPKSFLTDIDLDARGCGASPLRPRDNRTHSSPGMRTSRSESSAWALASKRPDLRTVGRVPVHGHEVSAPSKDVLEQDIRGYPKIRYPEWDFAKTCSRKAPALADKSDPGRYELNYNVVDAALKTGISFDKALGRDVCVRNLGYSAPPRVLHPDEEITQITSSTLRNPIPDRSHAKDAMRRRATHVNDMARELERPDLPVASKEYHDKNNPVADEAVMKHNLTFDIIKAEQVVKRRADIGPDYSRMLPRGKDAVQGLRALQGDKEVRGSIGLLFTETSGQREKQVAQLEARKVVGKRPDQGPRFVLDTKYQQLCNANNYLKGHGHVEHANFQGKVSTMQRTKLGFSLPTFKREEKDQAPVASKQKKSRPLQCHSVPARSRKHEAAADWASSTLPV